MKLQPLMTLHATIGDTLPVGDGGTGTRIVANVTGGHFEGERLHGKVQNSGADWVVIDAAGFGRVDVRIVLTTHDGANIYVCYQGLLEYNDRVRSALERQEATNFGDAYFMTQLRFETGHSDYSWLNQTLAVGEGRLKPGSVDYRIYALANA